MKNKRIFVVSKARRGENIKESWKVNWFHRHELFRNKKEEIEDVNEVISMDLKQTLVYERYKQ